MRIQFSAFEADGPKLIREIPDFELCYIEGENGIGKTLAIRVLEIATLGNPYLGSPAAWRTLRDQLGPVSIVVTGLSRGQELVYEITPSSWPADPALFRDDTEVARAKLAGKPISLHDAARMFRAFRVAGDETLQYAVGSELTVMAGRVRRVMRFLQPRIEQWDAALQAIADVVAGGDARSLEIASDELSVAREELHRQNKSLADLKTRSDALTELSDAAAATAQMIAEGAELATQARSTDGDLQALRQDIKGLDDQIAQMSSALQFSAAARRELEDAERLRVGRARRLADAESVERSLQRSLGLDSRPTVAAFRTLRTEAASFARDMAANLEALDLMTPLAAAAATLESSLARLPESLNDQIVVVNPSLSVAQLRKGVRARRVQLEGQPRAEDILRLQEQVEHANRRLGYFDLLRDEMDNADRKRDLLNQIDAKIEGLLRTISAGETKTYRDLHQQRDRLRAREIDLEVAHAGLVDRLRLMKRNAGALADEGDVAGGLDHAAAITRVRAMIQQLALEESEPILASVAESPDDESRFISTLIDALTIPGKALAEALEEAEALAKTAATTNRDAEVALLGVRQRIRSALHRLAAWHHTEVRNAISLLAAKKQTPLKGLLEELPVDQNPEGPVTGPEQVASWMLATVAARTGSLADHAESIVSTAGTAFAYVSGQARRLHGASVADDDALEINLSTVPREEALRSFVQDHVARLFAQRELLIELFDDSDRLAFDLNELQFEWDDHGMGRTRALDAFSSGEQVFAYTKAKLEALRSTSAGTEDVLVVLDEFGAFVSRDRLGSLLRFVESEALGSVARQVVVMLPLTSWVGQHPAIAIDDRPFDATLSEAEQVARWRYFARDALGASVFHRG